MCKVYDVSKSKLTSVSYMNEPRWNNSAISLNATIYSGGGKCGKSLRTAEYYDLANKKWKYIAPMNNARVDFGICAYNDSIYVVGGEGTMSTERYSPETNKWYPCPDMPESSSWWNRAALIEIYRMDLMGLLRAFDPREKTWYSLGDRAGGPEERYELFPYNGSLFCLTSKDFKRLDVRANKWELMPFMRFERVRFSATIVGGVIYVLRGKKESLLRTWNHFDFSLDIDGGIIYVHKVMFENDLQEKWKEFHKLEDTNAISI
uniref:Kelch-like protein diablo n=1 Tax=Glossina palpalis gambiensis TaxID=67801 RepID=A0A1B0BPJ5_9MUSC